MGQFQDFVSTTLSDGRITESEVPLIEAEIRRDGRIDMEDVRLLVELYCNAKEYCASFESLFFQILEQVILEDEEIDPSEQYYLLKMVYSDRVVRDAEKQFLVRLRDRVIAIAPGFAELCDEAMLAQSCVSSVGDGGVDL